MERLTYDFCHNGGHCNQVKGADNMECREVCNKMDACDECPISRAFDRLAAIEDILGDTYDLDRLRELVEADRDGRCVVFTVKQGDKLFYCDDCGVDTEIVEKIVVDIETDGGIYKPEEIGKTIFLSREAAEQALKEVEKDG